MSHLKKKNQKPKFKQLLLYNMNSLGLFCTLFGEACSIIPTH